MLGYSFYCSAADYTPTTWVDGPGGGTPITAAELNRMEAGIYAANDHADDNTTNPHGTRPAFLSDEACVYRGATAPDAANQ